ncbi:MAG: D-aminoacyl-tRNA deacylase [Halapricum sp.]
MLGIVVSRADSASVHIGEHLRDLADWEIETDDSRQDGEGGGTIYRLDDAEVREFDPFHLELDRVAEAFDDPDLIVFASRHSGETGKLLTAHHTGNFGTAEYGGEDGAFAAACPNAHKRVVEALTRHAPEDYEVGMECTHHGPTDVGAPSMFVEVGSAEPQWDDPDAARAVAKAVLDLRGVEPLAPREDGTRRHVLGFGGGHYVPRFERIVRETDWAVGHIGADWGLDAMGDPEGNRDVLEAAFEASAADHAVLAEDRPDLAAVVESQGYRVVGETFVRETTGVPLALVERIEDAIGPIDDGTRFGDRATEYEGEFVVSEVPVELRDEVQGIDPDATWQTVESVAIAFETVEGGARLGDRIALADESDRSEIIDGFAEVLESKYESVERTAEAVIAHKREFDPEKAQTLGIPEGPAFGKLSAGQPVVVDGETIDPDVVHVERERRFPL